MSSKSKIEWTDATWNPVTGCTPISAGCRNCYAKRFAERWRGVKGHPYEHGFDFRLRPERLEVPMGWREPRKIFVCSMADLFHTQVPDEFIQRVYDVMVMKAPRHTYQILTKRASRLQHLSTRLPAGANLWHGVSVENQRSMHRIDSLFGTACGPRRFVSFEPLLGPVNVSGAALAGVEWVIVGGETGPGARRMKGAWLRAIRDACVERNIPLLFKQWGPRGLGAGLDGRMWKEFPKT